MTLELKDIKRTNLKELVDFLSSLKKVRTYGVDIDRSSKGNVNIILLKGDVSWGEIDQFNIKVPKEWADLGMDAGDIEIFEMLGETSVNLNIEYTENRKGDYSWSITRQENLSTNSLAEIKEFFNRLI